MRYSVVNRVRGAFLGAFLGESLSNPNSFNLGKIAVLGTESLISLGKLDIDDWLARQEKAGIKLETNINSWGQIILATLPVMMFFHENTDRMRENILEVQKILNCQNEPVIRDTSLIIGYAIAQSLNERLNPHTLISETVSFIGKTSSLLPQQLIKVNDLLKKEAGLETAQRELNQSPVPNPQSPIPNPQSEKLISNIGLAFYCFLSTLEDFTLTVLRANQNQDLTSAVAGALSGAFNSTVGIPTSWQISPSLTNSPAWGLQSFTQMLTLADRMMAVWSGMYDLSNDFGECVETRYTIFAAPHIIRRR